MDELEKKFVGILEKLSTDFKYYIEESNRDLKTRHEALERDFYKKLDESNKRFENQLKTGHEALERDFYKKLDESNKQLDESNKKFKKQIKEINDVVGGIGKSNGLNAEEFFYKSLEETLSLGKYKFDEIEYNFSKFIKKKNLRRQFDVVMRNTDAIAVIEIKYRLTQNAVTKFYNETLSRFKELFPLYSTYKLLGGVASYSEEKDARKLAADHGLFVLGRAGNKIEMINSSVIEQF